MAKVEMEGSWPSTTGIGPMCSQTNATGGGEEQKPKVYTHSGSRSEVRPKCTLWQVMLVRPMASAQPMRLSSSRHSTCTIVMAGGKEIKRSKKWGRKKGRGKMDISSPKVAKS